jgi:LysM repeat protein
LKVKQIALAALLALAGLLAAAPASAQDNLLRDPGFEGTYTGRGRGDFNIPQDWNVWVGTSPRTEVWMNLEPTAFPHGGPGPDPHSGKLALNFSRGFATYTIAVYQQVTVAPETNFEAKAWGYLWTCDIPEDKDKCESSDDSGAYIRIGIDPNGGTDPNDSDVVWSGNMTPHDRWDDIGVSATSTGGTITVFVYTTQTKPKELNRVYLDDIELKQGGGGGSAGGGGGGGGGAPPPPTAPPVVAFVVPQGQQEDGSIVHTVQAGDTVDSIAVAYGLTRADLLTLNNISDPRIIQIGQRLLVRPATEDEEDEEEEEGARGRGGRNNNNARDEDEDEEAPEAAAGSETGDEDDEGDDSAEDENSDESTEEAPAEPTTPPATPTPAPTAPVVAVADAAVDPAASTASICVLLFNDQNQNRIQEEGEALLPGGNINLRTDAEALGEHATDGASEPHCFETLAAGSYVAAASAPDGYGLTTADQFRVQANPGTTINIAFGAAEGVVPAQPPAADNALIARQPAQAQVAPEVESNPLEENLGLIVLGAALVVFVLGMGVAFAMRGRG